MNVDSDPRDGLQTFADWLAHEMPAGTVIGDPKWWAPRIASAYESALTHARPEAVDAAAKLALSNDLHRVCGNTNRAMTDHLWSLGYRKVATITPDQSQ